MKLSCRVARHAGGKGSGCNWRVAVANRLTFGAATLFLSLKNNNTWREVFCESQYLSNLLMTLEICLMIQDAPVRVPCLQPEDRWLI